MEFLILLFVALQIADAYTTTIFLGLGVREGNPWIAALIARYGAKSVILVKATSAWAYLALSGFDPQSMTVGPPHVYATITVCVLYIAVIAWNLYNIRRAKDGGDGR